MFEQAGVPFFEGCLIVEVHEHRKSAAAPEPNARHGIIRLDRNNTELMYLREGGRYGRSASGSLGRGARDVGAAYPGPDGVEVYRVVLQPTIEALWSDLKDLDAKRGGLWSDEEALQAEATILNLTAPPLCLTPDPHAMRMANWMLSSTMPPAFFPQTPSFQPYRREKGTGNKLNSVECEQERSQDARREQIMAMMKDGWSTAAPHAGNGEVGADRSFVPTFSRLDFLRNWRKTRAGMASQAPSEAAAAAPKPPEAAGAKKKKASKDKEAAAPKKPEPPAASSPPETGKARSKPKRRKTDEGSSPPERQAPRPKSVLYPGGQPFPAAPKAQPSFPAFNVAQMPGKMSFDDKSLVLPGTANALPQNVLPNSQVLPAFGTPTLGMQGVPSTFNSPQAQTPAMPAQPMEQEQTGWMYP